MRGAIKSALASAVHLSRADRLFAALRGQRRQAVVLGYHRVVDDFAKQSAHAFPAMLISRAMLERHLDWVARRFQIVSLEDLRSRLDTQAAGARPLAAITFDDGYRDVYEHAFPLLMRKGLPATVFVATNFVGTPSVFPHDRLYLLLARASHRWPSFPRELARVLQHLNLALPERSLREAARSPHTALRTVLTTLPEADVQRIIAALEAECGGSESLPHGLRPLTWNMVTEMSRGGVSVGSHTRSHSLLTNESPAKVVEETMGSQQDLAKRLGKPATCFAYPDGRFDAAAVRAVAAAGYTIAVTTCRHRDPDHPWLTVPRVLLWERSSVDARGRFSPAILSCQMSGVFDPNCCRHPHGRAFQTPSSLWRTPPQL